MEKIEFNIEITSEVESLVNVLTKVHKMTTTEEAYRMIFAEGINALSAMHLGCKGNVYVIHQDVKITKIISYTLTELCKLLGSVRIMTDADLDAASGNVDLIIISQPLLTIPRISRFADKKIIVLYTSTINKEFEKSANIIPVKLPLDVPEFMEIMRIILK